MPTITIDYGYDIHSIEVESATLDKIKAGLLIQINGQGFLSEEEGTFVDQWHFNEPENPAYFALENGATFYSKEVWFED